MKNLLALILLISFFNMPLAVAKESKKSAKEVLSLSSLFRSTVGKKRVGANYVFSGTVDDSIDYAELCLATDGTCASCEAPFAKLSTGTALPYTTGGTAYAIHSPSLAAYFAKGDLAAGTYHVGIYVKSSHLNCNSSNSYCSTQFDNTAARLCFSAAYNGTAVTSITQNDNGNAILNDSTSQWAYVSDSDGHAHLCSLNADGTLNDCSLTAEPGGTWDPFAISFARVNGSQFAYVADNGNCIIQKCGLDGDGGLVDCVATPVAGAPGWCPVGITLGTVGSTQYAYVSDNVSTNLYRCTIDTDTGAFTACAATPAGAQSWNPFAVAFTSVSGTQWAYVADGNGGVAKCSLNADGSFAACADITPGAVAGWTPNGLTVSTVGGTRYAYVASNNDNIFQCTISPGDDFSGGDFTECTPALAVPPAWNPRGVNLSRTNGTLFAYVADIGGNIYKCNLNGGGAFTACAVTAPSLRVDWHPRNIAFTFTR